MLRTVAPLSSYAISARACFVLQPLEVQTTDYYDYYYCYTD